MSSLDAYRESRSPSRPAERTKVMVLACSLCDGAGSIEDGFAARAELKMTCPRCGGDGMLRMVPKANACLRCRGDGVQKYQDGTVVAGEACMRCEGTGRERELSEFGGRPKRERERCGTCNGEGWVYAHEATTATKDCPACKP